jgi:hypothetical protein
VLGCPWTAHIGRVTAFACMLRKQKKGGERERERGEKTQREAETKETEKQRAPLTPGPETEGGERQGAREPPKNELLKKREKGKKKKKKKKKKKNPPPPPPPPSLLPFLLAFLGVCVGGRGFLVRPASSPRAPTAAACSPPGWRQSSCPARGTPRCRGT